MIKILKSIPEKSNLESNPFENRTRLAWLQTIKSQGFDRGVEHNFSIAREMLRSGYTVNAIELINSVLDTMSTQESFFYNYSLPLTDLLAISYFRLGEDENCLQDNSTDNCILPFRESNIHSKRRGAEKAIELLEYLLNYFPNNYTYHWLLNLSYMAIGKYPDEVPQQWVIPNLEGEELTHSSRYRDVAQMSGIDGFGRAGGSAVEDYDQDGFYDIISSSWGLSDQVHYYRNMGDGQFEKRTIESNLLGITGGLNMVQGDYNNDGFTDLFILRTGWLGDEGAHPNSLLRNNGDGTFTDVTILSGVYSENPTQTACWGDYNNDGWIDLFVGNETWPEMISDEVKGIYTGSSKTEKIHKSELFLNNQDGTFSNVAQETGLDVIGFIKGAIWLDINNDGWQDLYLSRLGEKNLLFENQGYMNDVDIFFKDVSEQAGVFDPIDSFPVLSFDINNDGWEDIFVSGYSNSSGDVARDYLGLRHNGETPRLYLNNKDGTFKDITLTSGMSHPLLTMGCNYGDINNDGYLDIYLGTGDPDLRSVQPNRMFLNDKGKAFRDITFSSRFGHLQKGHGVSFSDFDNDGDLDIFSVIGGAYEGDIYKNILLENPGDNDNNWIGIELKGSMSNRDAIGARIAIETDRGLKIYRTISSGGTFGQSPFAQLIGIGHAKKVKSIEVIWPGSTISQVIRDLDADKWYLIEQGDSNLSVIPKQSFNFF